MFPESFSFRKLSEGVRESTGFREPVPPALLVNMLRQDLPTHGLSGHPKRMAHPHCPAHLFPTGKLYKTGWLWSADGWGEELCNLCASRLRLSLSDAVESLHAKGCCEPLMARHRLETPSAAGAVKGTTVGSDPSEEAMGSQGRQSAF